MAFEDQYLDVLQNIEFAIISVYRQQPSLRDSVLQENYQRNPEYLFARINYAEVCLARKDYTQVADIFAHTFDLHALYPQRKRFHLSEVANFMGVAGLYFLAIGHHELAAHYDAFLQDVAPDFPITRRLHRRLFPGLLRRLWRRATGMIIRS